MRLFLVSLLLLIAPAAHADLGAAQQAYAEGRWSDAADLAQSAGGAEGYAFAAGALIAQLMVEADHPDRESLASTALDLTEEAYRIDDEHVDARLRLATALGYRGRYMSSMGAYIRRIPQRGRSLIEETVEEYPDHAWAVGMLGAWHLEVARRGGDRGMRTLNASIDAGIGYYTQSIAMDPYNPAPRLFLGIALLALEEEAYRAMAIEQVTIAAALEPRDAFEAGIIAEALVLGALLGDHDAASAWCNARMRS